MKEKKNTRRKLEHRQSTTDFKVKVATLAWIPLDGVEFGIRLERRRSGQRRPGNVFVLKWVAAGVCLQRIVFGASEIGPLIDALQDLWTSTTEREER